MTQEQKEALIWLDGQEIIYEKMLPGSLGYSFLQSIRTLKAMLEEPRLPEEPTPEALAEIKKTLRACAPDWEIEVYRALYAHLTRPKTKLVWRVGWADKFGQTHECDFDTLDIAVPNYKAAANNVHYRGAYLKGPHEVPA